MPGVPDRREVNMDEYDKALVFALKKWISDEINEIYDNKVYAVGLTFDSDGAVGYNTKDYADKNGSMWDISGWKHPEFARVNSDAAVDGSVEIWSSFKGLSGEDMRTGYFECAAAAVRELIADGIIRERFDKNIPVVIFADGAGGELTRRYTLLANEVPEEVFA